MDVKKLIVGFLILAMSTASSVLILSEAGSVSSRATVASGTATDTALAFTDQNAFVPTQADILNAVAGNDPDVAVALNDPNNLTANFTDVFLNSVSAANPTGLGADSSGNVIMTQPDEGSITAAFLKTSALQNVQVPNWDAEAAAIKTKTSVGANPTTYAAAISATFDKNIVQPGIQTSMQSMASSQSADPSGLSAITPAIQNVLSDVAQTPTPASLVDFNKSLVKMLVYEKNMLALVATANADPVKVAILYQAEQGKYTAAVQGFQSEEQKMIQQKLLSFGKGPVYDSPSDLVAFFDGIVGIKTAHAFLGIGDVTFDPAVFGEFVLQVGNDVAVQILRNTITAFLQQRVLKWIQNSGAPKFVQQWGATLATAYTQKAIASMSRVITNTCPNIGPLLRPIQTNLINSVGGNSNALNCPIPAASLSQVGNFFSNFNAPGVQALPGGSWGLYAQVLNPNGGNYYATLLGASDYVNSQGSAAQQARQTKLTSNQGYAGDEVCANGSDPNGTSWYCDNGYGDAAASDGVCVDGSTAVEMPNNGQCSDGSEPEVQTPGQTTLQAQSEALGGAMKLTTNANSVGGVLASIATSLLNTLVAAGANAAIKAGTHGLTQITLSATAGGPSNNGGTSLTGTSIPAPLLPAQPPTTCLVESQQCSGGQCQSFHFGDTVQFAATGGDGYSFNWSVGQAEDVAGHGLRNASGASENVVATPDSAFDIATFSPSFMLPGDGMLEVPAGDSLFPITVPVTVTGSDNISDTCVVDIVASTSTTP